MTRDALMRAIFEAQLNKPAALLTGTINWAAYIADEVLKPAEEPAEPELAVFANNQALKEYRT